LDWQKSQVISQVAAGFDRHKKISRGPEPLRYGDIEANTQNHVDQSIFSIRDELGENITQRAGLSG
jgi:hypothetical protein